MIEWKKYNRNTPPELDKMYLIKHHGGITSGEVYVTDGGRLVWQTYTGHIVNVSHYAELNWPVDSDPTE